MSNINGLLLDRDFEVLSDDDLAEVKALNNEYLYYEQKQDKAIMEAIGYEIVKIRQKDIYFDRYNSGPYVNRAVHKPNDNIKVLKSVLGTGDVWLLGGKTTETEIMEEIRKLFMLGAFGKIYDILIFISSLDAVHRADIRIQVLDDRQSSQIVRDSCYYRSDSTIFQRRVVLVCEVCLNKSGAR